MHRALLSTLSATLWILTLTAATWAQSTYEAYYFGTFAGIAPGSADGTGSAARFYRPTAVAVDSAGNVYVADQNNHTIRKITPAGVVSTLAGLANRSGSADGTGSAARFYGPTGVAVDSAGNVYVADQSNSTRKITPAGVVSTFAGTPGNFGNIDGSGVGVRFNYPTGVAVDSAGNVYVANRDSHTIRKVTPAGVVSTMAGQANSSGSADGTGSAARFNRPAGVAVDGDSNVYVADQTNHTIRKVTPGGVVSTLAGQANSSGSTDGTGSAARFFNPWSVAVDSASNVYVADAGNNTIRRITPAGVVSTVAGVAGSEGFADGAGNAARFRIPTGVALDSAGNLYVADQFNHTTRKITPAGVVSTLAGLPGSGGSADGTGSAAQFDGPAGIAFDDSGNLYVADSGNHTIRKITAAGEVSTFAGLAGSSGSVDGTGSAARFHFPSSVGVDSASNVYVVDRFNFTIRKITPAGVVSTVAGLAGTWGSTDGSGSAARFYYPSDLAVDSESNVYVADEYNHTIRKITPAGVVSTLAGLAGTWGSADGVGSGARFYSPRGLAVDGAGNVYVADLINSTVRKITPAGVVSTPVGMAGSSGSADGAGSAARFNRPLSVALDAASNVYVADTENRTIRKITPDRVVTTLAGLAGWPGSADGTGSAARFVGPRGLAIDGAGKVYVSDSGNDTIRVGDQLPLALAEARSRTAHGTRGAFDFSLTLSGTPAVECRSGGANGDHTLVFVFNHDLASASAAVTEGTGSIAAAPTLSGTEVLVSVTGVANAQTLTVTLSNLADNLGYTLPDTSVSVGFLLGDTNGDRAVNSGDAQQTRNRSGQATDATNFRSDVNLDGGINSGDAFIVRSLSGSALP